jgi:hypothetical protein
MCDMVARIGPLRGIQSASSRPAGNSYGRLLQYSILKYVSTGQPEVTGYSVPLNALSDNKLYQNMVKLRYPDLFMQRQNAVLYLCRTQISLQVLLCLSLRSKSPRSTFTAISLWRQLLSAQSFPRYYDLYIQIACYGDHDLLCHGRTLQWNCPILWTRRKDPLPATHPRRQRKPFGPSFSSLPTEIEEQIFRELLLIRYEKSNVDHEESPSLEPRRVAVENIDIAYNSHFPALARNIPFRMDEVMFRGQRQPLQPQLLRVCRKGRDVDRRILVHENTFVAVKGNLLELPTGVADYARLHGLF